MLTLQQIRDKSPCGDGWTKLLKSLGNPPMDTVISLGDVAKSNGAGDAWWCDGALDWSDRTLRRQVIAALIPSLERAAKHTTDKRVHDCIVVIHDWVNGKAVDLKAAERAAWAAGAVAEAAARAAARAAGAAWAAAGAAWAVEGAAKAAARAVEGTAARAAGAAEAARAAAWAAEAAARAVEGAAARAAGAAARAAGEAEWAAEMEAQRADLIAAFPPLILKD